MARHKTRELKEFLVAQRNKVGPGYLNTPVWIIQKAGKRIWNRKQKRNWKETEFGVEFRALQAKNEKLKEKSTKKSGKRFKSAKYNPYNRKRNTTDLDKKKKK